MKRIKIDYGIDLGTTNSSICRMEKGEPVVIKTDTLKETLPSCVSINKKGSVKVGDAAYNTMKSDKRRATKNWADNSSNTFVEFKRTMGTDMVYKCTSSELVLTSEQLSSEVLMALKSFVTDETVRSVVITVPAKFTVGQKTATIQAAQMAGFDHCELLQEPIAAAYAYGLSSENKNGTWLVFDFGGGTFDVALLKAKDGILQVYDTAGDNYLGGKDLDAAVVDKIIIPHLTNCYAIGNILADKERNTVFREAMKTYAEEVKNQLSFKSSEDILSNLGDLGIDDNGEEIELDMTVSQSQLFDVMRPVFQKAIDICKSLLDRNSLRGSDIDRLILIGGPTYSPLIRQMLREQISPNLDTSINPMTAVATGAALYASTINAIEDASILTEDNEILLDVDYEATTVEQQEWVSVKISSNSPGMTPPEHVQIEISRSDYAWSSGKVSINRLGDVIEINLIEGKSNTFIITCYNDQGMQIPCFPAEFTILQGTKVGSALMPYNIGVAMLDMEKDKLVFKGAIGLEKNKPLPAVGVINNLYTSSPLRPGMSEDKLTIPVYQCEDSPNIERTATLYEYVADIVVTGEDVRALIPVNSPVDITLSVNASEQMTMDIYFPVIDFTVSKQLDTSKKQSVQDAETQIPRMLHDAQKSINRLNEIGIKTDDLESELNYQLESGKNNPEKKAVLQHLKEVLRKIEDKEADAEWVYKEKEIRERFELLEMANNRQGLPISSDAFQQLRIRRDQVLLSKNVEQAKDFIEQIQTLYVQHNLLYMCMGFIEYCDNNFGNIKWRDSQRARYLIQCGKNMMINNPNEEQLHALSIQIQELIDDNNSTFLHPLKS
ncbi:MAG: Hsp70 family protein [Bacteroidales bacterium]|nr:Hsp70 family protein [Bacteroidales bacterium]